MLWWTISLALAGCQCGLWYPNCCFNDLCCEWLHYRKLGYLNDTVILQLTRHDTRFKETKDLITKLVRLTIETGTLTATIAVVDAILLLAVLDSDYHMTPALVLAGLYSNTLLMKFNSRITFSHEGSESDIGSRMIFDTHTDHTNADSHLECLELGTSYISRTTMFGKSESEAECEC